MRVLRHLVAATVALLWAAGCGANHQDSPVVAPTTPPTQDATGADSLPAAVSLVLASLEGVDQMMVNGDLTRLSHRPAAVAYGIRDNLVVFQGSDGAGDVYPPPPVGPVEMWADGTLRELPEGPGVSSVRLLDAGLINSRPVVLVAEKFSEAQPERAAEALVLVDLEDLARLTVVPRQPAWESGHQAAHLQPDGDIIGLYHQGVQVHLIRWSAGEGKRAWSVKVAEDRVVDLVASDASVAVVQPSFDRRRGLAPILTVTRYDPATGEPQDPTMVDVADPEGAIDTGLRCRDWLTASELACAHSGGAPVGVSVDGSFHELGGPPGAIPSVVNEP
jgi:hypothetical protein